MDKKLCGLNPLPAACKAEAVADQLLNFFCGQNGQAGDRLRMTLPQLTKATP